MKKTTKTWIEVNEIIARCREHEINEELFGDGSYNKKLSELIARREQLLKEEEPKFEEENLNLRKLTKPNFKVAKAKWQCKRREYGTINLA